MIIVGKTLHFVGKCRVLRENAGFSGKIRERAGFRDGTGLHGVRDGTGLSVVRDGTGLFFCPKKQLWFGRGSDVIWRSDVQTIHLQTSVQTVSKITKEKNDI
jgi:hypothetical protein